MALSYNPSIHKGTFQNVSSLEVDIIAPTLSDNCTLFVMLITGVSGNDFFDEAVLSQRPALYEAVTVNDMESPEGTLPSYLYRSFFDSYNPEWTTASPTESADISYEGSFHTTWFTIEESNVIAAVFKYDQGYFDQYYPGFSTDQWAFQFNGSASGSWMQLNVPSGSFFNPSGISSHTFGGGIDGYDWTSTIQSSPESFRINANVEQLEAEQGSSWSLVDLGIPHLSISFIFGVNDSDLHTDPPADTVAGQSYLSLSIPETDASIRMFLWEDWFDNRYGDGPLVFDQFGGGTGQIKGYSTVEWLLPWQPNPVVTSSFVRAFNNNNGSLFAGSIEVMGYEDGPALSQATFTNLREIGYTWDGTQRPKYNQGNRLYVIDEGKFRLIHLSLDNIGVAPIPGPGCSHSRYVTNGGGYYGYSGPHPQWNFNSNSPIVPGDISMSTGGGGEDRPYLEYTGEDPMNMIFSINGTINGAQDFYLLHTDSDQNLLHDYYCWGDFIGPLATDEILVNPSDRFYFGYDWQPDDTPYNEVVMKAFWEACPGIMTPLDDIGRSGQNFSTSEITIDLPMIAPSGRLSTTNDIIIAIVINEGSTNPAAPSGWSRIVNQNFAVGKYAAYRRVRIADETTLSLDFGSAVSSTVLVLNIPSNNGLSAYNSNSFATVADIDPNPITFVDNVGGLQLFVPSATEDLEQSNPNEWENLILIDGFATIGAWAFLGPGPVPQFDLNTPGDSFPQWCHQADIDLWS